MKSYPHISELMTTRLLTVSPEDNLTVVQEAFANKRIHHLPVARLGKLVGIISKSDFLYFINGASSKYKGEQSVDSDEKARLEHFKASEIMTTGIASLNPDHRLDVAIEIFKENILHAIPIVEGDNELVGIITTHDIIKWLAADL